MRRKITETNYFLSGESGYFSGILWIFPYYQIYTYKNDRVYMTEDKGGIIFKYKVVLDSNKKIISQEKLNLIIDNTVAFIEQDGIKILSP
jgi:hypothetical protein